MHQKRTFTELKQPASQALGDIRQSMMTDLLTTPLLPKHEELNAKIVDFGGWALPVNYGSQIEEHNSVRQDAGMFDVSHMTVSDVKGTETIAFLSYILANDINKVTQTPGKALYSCMLNQQAGVIDDLIVYYINEQHCRLVTNAGTNKKDMDWLNTQASAFDVSFAERPDLALLAVQGPNALQKCIDVLEPEFAKTVGSLNRFQGAFYNDEFAGRTGYTGEDGIEFIVTPELASSLWDKLLNAGVQPCGLGARDTLRLESGMSLYGNDLDEQHSPLESGLKWTVSLNDERDFIGKTALQTNSAQTKMIGLILDDRGVLRGHQRVVHDGVDIGEITSGTFSPSLEQSIAIARVNHSAELKVGDKVQIAVRKKLLSAIVAHYPFVKNGVATNTL